MNLFVTVVLYLAALQSVLGEKVDCDFVKPFAQPEPVTVLEKVALKFKPTLLIDGGCVSFPAVNEAGAISSGLRPLNGNDGCIKAPQGSQVYGRSTQFQDKWAIMFAWYFPKGFWSGMPSRRHDWASMVVWIDDPDFETPKLLGVSLSKSKKRYTKATAPLSEVYFAGFQEYGRRGYKTYVNGSSTSIRISHSSGFFFGPASLDLSTRDGDYQDLIMWKQLTEEARKALNSANFGKSVVPFNDDNFEDMLEKAWPF
ncbi:hypothetical protein PPTG_13004 [Phytophthora nicotianae INRA-310]|uniref:Uncharacterized protein n=1 Tax=Phytophthora nicotianae (strain INRA-310) TaxID=761204 RepID=W2Q523_PHYN3|nr:hypothetical protein PPTG_13004 [Phytophthora nicotianae INRA-310]ETN07664.1 hypothetical protein PPTG_13004 [Phytophthora nicotianae INRA-310]